MKKTLVLFILLFFLPLSSYSATPTEVYNDALKHFKLGYWQEAEESFKKYLDTWPEHQYKEFALLYKSLSQARLFEKKTNELAGALALKLETVIPDLQTIALADELIELKIAISQLKSLDSKPDWDLMEQLKPEQVNHIIARGWFFEPSKDPFSALKWSKNWLSCNKNISPELLARISLIKAYAIWSLIKSPVACQANNSFLDELMLLPLEENMAKTLELAFKLGNEDIKRETAELAYHYEYFLCDSEQKKRFTQKQNKWLSYLIDRGLSQGDFLCPK